MLYLAIIFAILLAYLALKNFSLALALFIFSLPVYLIRFNIGPLPTALLEVAFGVIFIVWLFKFARADWLNIKNLAMNSKFLLFCFFAFLLSSIIGIFVSDMWWFSLGQWRAYFLEPMLSFIVLVGRSKELDFKNLIFCLALGTVPVSLLAIFQKFSPGFYPPALWDDQTFGRATSFFTTPNAIGLFILPSLFLTFALLKDKIFLAKNPRLTKSILIFIPLIGFLALIFSRSLGAGVGLLAGALTLVYFLYSKKIATIAILLIFFVLISPLSQFTTPNTFTSIRNRIILWRHTKTFLTSSPKNFIFGAGIRQYFRKVEKSFYQPKELERLIYPHNILLNFWTEIGLIGALAFTFIFISILRYSYLIYKNDKIIGAVFMAALTALFVHGLVDVPYFKNDLAFLFWIMASLIIIANNFTTARK